MLKKKFIGATVGLATLPAFFASRDKSDAAAFNQSPIDIKPYASVVAREDNAPFKILSHDHDNVLPLINNGAHSLGVDCVDCGSVALKVYDEKKDYFIKQFHEHKPAEHTIDGKQAEMEWHFVHENEKGERLVVALMVNEGEENPEIQKIVEQIDHSTEETHLISLNALLADMDDSFIYEGSLTTGNYGKALWVICKKPISMSAKQIEILGKAHEGNNREIQPQKVPVFDAALTL